MTSDSNHFDGRLAVFYWQPASIAETNIGHFADNLRAAAPNVNAVIIKTNTGAGWQGKWDSSNPNLAINRVADVQRWVRELAAHGLECHAWCVVRGSLVGPELERLVEIGRDGGVRSLLLSLERDAVHTLPARRAGFVGNRAAAERLAVGLRQRLGPDFHLGLMFDARGTKPQALFIQSVWFPEIDSLHPMVYHRQYGQALRPALKDCYDTLMPWGKPIYPVLQAFGLPTLEVAEAVTTLATVHQAPGASLFRYGTGGGNGLSRDELGHVAARWPATQPVAAPARRASFAAMPGASHSPAAAVASAALFAGPAAQRRGTAGVLAAPAPHASPGVDIPGGRPALTMVDSDDERNGLFAIGYYGDPAALAKTWVRDRDTNGRARLYRPAAYNTQTLYVGYTPRLAGKGLYTIEVFVPRDHAFIRDAHYFIVDYPRGIRRETLAILDQSAHFDAWVPLKASLVNGVPADRPVAEFSLDPLFPDAGRVNVADVTFVDPATHAGGGFDMSFGAIRWRPYVKDQPVIATGLDSPVGTAAERAGEFADGSKLFSQYYRWCGDWYDANPIGSRYRLGSGWAIHTGADLNLSGPGGVLADKDAPVHAMGNGRVISAGYVSGGWTNIVVIEHPVPGEDQVIYARYAHVTNLLVSANDVVTQGQQICAVGEYAPNNYHLHFDLTYNPILKTLPGHWPGDNLSLVMQVYVDPKAFIKARHVVR